MSSKQIEKSTSVSRQQTRVNNYSIRLETYET
jgi:hypothetical protein